MGHDAGPARPCFGAGTAPVPRIRRRSAAHRSSPAVTDRLSMVMPRMTGSSTRTDPPSPMSLSVTPCSPRKNARVTTNDGIPTLARSTPIASPISAPHATPTRIPAHHGQPWLTMVSRHRACRHSARDSRGQVDVADQEHEDQSHSQHADRARLGDQVGQVEGRHEPLVGEAEHDEQHHKPEHRRKRPHVAAAHPLRIAAGGVEERLVRARVGCKVGVGEFPVERGHFAVLYIDWAASAGARPRFPERPAVISSTTWLWVTSDALTSAATRPR